MRKEIIVPSELEDITLRQYQAFLKLGDDIKHEELISIFCNMTVVEALQLPINVFEQATLKVVEVLTTAQQEVKHTQTLVLNGVKYGMIPNLEKISYGENKDLTTYLSDWQNMHMAMAVLYRPIEKTFNGMYSIESYEGASKHKEAMLDMPLNHVIGANSFFYNLTEALLNAIPSYLERVIRNSNSKTVQSFKDQQMQEEYIKQTGDPMMRSIALLKETLEGLKR
tara:strand:+ start:921 stop:1595 length:675 start_codon:yes stop_codon:yes gene_type:complete